MSTIDANGMLVESKVIARRSSGIEHGALPEVLAIVVHQTDPSTPSPASTATETVAMAPISSSTRMARSIKRPASTRAATTSAN
jgi:hypothetical protein